MKGTLIEARCPNVKCGRTHHVMRYEDGTLQQAFCPPGRYHRRWRMTKVGSVQVATRKAIAG